MTKKPLFGRRVMVREFVRETLNWEESHKATFLEFSTYSDFTDGGSGFSDVAAVLEKDDGTVESVGLSAITFLPEE